MCETQRIRLPYVDDEWHLVYTHPEGFWDKFFLGMAEYISQASKDPSTKCGAVIVRPDNTVASMGYNGFPRGVWDWKADYDDRTEKYARVIHAEMNAILHAPERLDGYSIYIWPLPPCSACMASVIQTGIVRVVTLKPPEDMDRWKGSWATAAQMAHEAGVEVVHL